MYLALALGPVQLELDCPTVLVEIVVGLAFSPFLRKNLINQCFRKFMLVL